VCNRTRIADEYTGAMRMQYDDDHLRDLMRAGLAGDGIAHTALLRALVPPLRGFFRRRLGGREDDVEDLLQETLIAVHQRRATYDPSRPFGAWLFAIARYKLVDRYRRNGRRSARTTALDDLDELPDEFVFAEASDARADLDRLFEAIPEKQAAVLRATRIEGLSTAEAAERFGIGESDVKVSAHRGLRALAGRVRDSLR
jgi:RNA polymerase sigma factor (sigma-70 family)